MYHWNQEVADKIIQQQPNATVFINGKSQRLYLNSIKEAREMCDNYEEYFLEELLENGETRITENMKLFSFDKFEKLLESKVGNNYTITYNKVISPKVIYDDGRVYESKEVKIYVYHIC